MNSYRLDKLANYLETVKKKNFDMDVWTCRRNKHGDRKDFKDGDEPGKTCGTTACAIGHCPHAFPEDWHYEDFRPVLKDPLYRPIDQASSAMEYFDLDNMDFGYLFMPTYYKENNPKPKDVANRIREFVKSRLMVYQERRALIA